MSAGLMKHCVTPGLVRYLIFTVSGIRARIGQAGVVKMSISVS